MASNDIQPGTAPSGRNLNQNYVMYSSAYGQPFQPYPEDSNFDQLRFPPNRAWEITKLVFHGAGIICSICGFSLALSLYHRADAGLDVLLISIPLIIAFLWSAAELITRAIRRWTSGIHPGAHVGVCLLLWIANGFLSGIFGVSLGQTIDNFYNCDDDNNFNDPDNFGPNPFSPSSSSPECDVAAQHRARNISIAATAFGGAVVIIYFVLFIGACVDTHKRNASKRPIMVVANRQQWEDLQQEVQPMREADELGVTPQRE